MAIGTSSGEYYDNLFAFHARGFNPHGDDNNVIDPSTTPDLEPGDDMDITRPHNPPKEIPVANIPTGTSPNIEDRRDEPNKLDLPGMKAAAEREITSYAPLWAAEKMQPYFYGKDLEKPDTPLSDALGGKEIKDWADSHRTVGEESPLDNLINTFKDDATTVGKSFNMVSDNFRRADADVSNVESKQLSGKEIDKLTKGGREPGTWYLKDVDQNIPQSQMSRDLGSQNIEDRLQLLGAGQRRAREMGLPAPSDRPAWWPDNFDFAK